MTDPYEGPERRNVGWLDRHATLIITTLAVVDVLTLFVTLIVALNQSGAIHNANDAIDESRQTQKAIVAVQVQNCQDDHQFRVQYKLRGQAELKLLNLFLDLSRTELATGQVMGVPITPEQRKQAQDFIDRFGPLADKIDIIPVPNCQQEAQRLQRAVQSQIGG